jgi:hypothetical protein
VRAIDLTTAASGDLLAPCCATCTWWLTRPGIDAGPGLRGEWQREAEAEAGFFGRALVDGDAVIGWMHVASSRLIPRGRCLPAGPPSADAYVLTCAYFYDEEYLHGFRFLLQEIEAALKHRRAAALEAFGLRHTRAGDAFRGYLRELNLFNPDVLEGGGFRRVQEKGEVARFRLDLAALVEAPRRSVAWEHVQAPAGTQPV